jgi:hypothetical protein
LKEQVADPSAMQTKVSRDLSLTKQWGWLCTSLVSITFIYWCRWEHHCSTDKVSNDVPMTPVSFQSIAGQRESTGGTRAPCHCSTDDVCTNRQEKNTRQTMAISTLMTSTGISLMCDEELSSILPRTWWWEDLNLELFQ